MAPISSLPLARCSCVLLRVGGAGASPRLPRGAGATGIRLLLRVILIQPVNAPPSDAAVRCGSHAPRKDEIAQAFVVNGAPSAVLALKKGPVAHSVIVRCVHVAAQHLHLAPVLSALRLVVKKTQAGGALSRRRVCDAAEYVTEGTPPPAVKTRVGNVVHVNAEALELREAHDRLAVPRCGGRRRARRKARAHAAWLALEAARARVIERARELRNRGDDARGKARQDRQRDRLQTLFTASAPPRRSISSRSSSE